MDLTPYTQNLRDDLITAASVGDEDSRRAAALLAGALEPATRLAIMNALSDLAAEVTGALEDTTVELRLDGRDVRVSVTRHTPNRRPRGDVAIRRAAYGGSRLTKNAAPSGPSRRRRPRRRTVRPRTTDRLPMTCAGPCRTPAASCPGPPFGCSTNSSRRPRRAASDQGVSLNTYISRAVSDSVRSAVPNKGNHRGRGETPERNVTGYFRG